MFVTTNLTVKIPAVEYECEAFVAVVVVPSPKLQKFVLPKPVEKFGKIKLLPEKPISHLKKHMSQQEEIINDIIRLKDHQKEPKVLDSSEERVNKEIVSINR
jgi:hypothetical protein